MSYRRHRKKTEPPFILALMIMARRTPWWGNIAIGTGLYLGLMWFSRFQAAHVEGPLAPLYAMASTMAGYVSYVTSIPFVLLGIIQFVNGAPTKAVKKEPHNKSAQEEARCRDTTRASVKSVAEHGKEDSISALAIDSQAHLPLPLSSPQTDGRNLSEWLMEAGNAYIAQKSLLTPAEKQAYRLLRQTYADSVLICPKVRVVDVITPNTARYHGRSREFISLFRQLSQWHLDFVLVDPITFQVLCALELDDNSHLRADRQKRDRILNSAFDSAGVRLERMTLQSGSLHTIPVAGARKVAASTQPERPEPDSVAQDPT